ncbi:MAG: RlmE family RNA methyltransferase [Hydrogenophilus sp.]|nr:RlmE family RNA methyltransferase [Hydrogenophilus sp.]
MDPLWLRRHQRDPYVRRSRVEGYRSRAAYKLLEIDARERVLRSGARVVDLGAAPGSWSQVAAARVGRQGQVIAVDLLPLQPLPGVTVVEGDFCDAAVVARVEALLGGEAVDAVLSDMAPNLSGVWDRDVAHALELAERALAFAVQHLKENGAFLVKVFQGEGVDAFRHQMGRVFELVKSLKPASSRAESREFYLLGRGVRSQLL